LHVEKYANEAETSLKLFQAVSALCSSFISECSDVWNKTMRSVVGWNKTKL